MNILQRIFTDYYKEIKYTLHHRSSEMENIEKMINCGDSSFGGAMYGCPHCGNLKSVPFRYHSRFFPSCGNKYSMERTTSMSFKLVNVQHRHCLIFEGGYSYDGVFVTFHYNRHEDDQYVQETIPVMDFIKRLIRHIPEKHFKMIRYGGLYARHRSIDKKLHLAISKEKQQTFRSFNRWRTSILSSFGYDPLICPHCKQQMVILEIYHNHRRVPLEELYEKAMSRSRGKRSSA